MTVNRLLTIGLILCTYRATAQEINFEQLAGRFPDRTAICLKEEQVVNFEIVKDQLKVSSLEKEEIIYLTDLAPNFSRKNIYFSGFNPVGRIEALTKVPNGRGFKNQEVKEFRKKSVETEGIFFDDVSAYEFDYPYLQKGAVTSLTYEREFKEPKLLTGFYFGRSTPVLEANLTIIADKNVTIRYKTFNTDQIDLIFKKEEKGKQVIYSWSARNIPDFKGEERSPDARYLIPHILFHVEKVSTNGGEVKHLSGVNDLYTWYYSMIDSLHTDSSEVISHLVDSLVQGIDNPADKASRLYYWVQDNIRYVAFEDGMRGFIPHPPGYVYDKRFGDCKDMSSLLHSMFLHAGIESYLTWIGTRDLPYSYHELPTPNVDNHMIVACNVGQGLQYVDATSKYTPFGYPSSMTQGKEALVAMGPEKFEVGKVPVLEMNRNQYWDSVHIRLNEQLELQGEGRMVLDGYSRINWTHSLNRKSESELKETMIHLLGKGNNKFFVDTFSLNNLEKRDQPLIIDYNCRIRDYSNTAGNELYFNMNLDRYLLHQKIDTRKRKSPYENEFRYITGNVVSLEIPEGYEVEYLPSDVEFDQERFGFSIVYHKQNASIIQEKRIWMNYLLLQPAEFETWNSMIKAISDAYGEAVILKKILNE